MAIEAHLENLTQRHQALETAISTEMKRPIQDDRRMQELKRQKLRLKDEIHELRQKS